MPTDKKNENISKAQKTKQQEISSDESVCSAEFGSQGCITITQDEEPSETDHKTEK